MKILIVTGSLFEIASGPFLSVRSLARSLHLRKDIEKVTVFGTKDRNSQPQQPPNYSNGFNVVALNKYGPYSIHFCPRIIPEIKKHDFDIVNFQGIWQWNFWRVAKYCRKNKIPYTITIRGEFKKEALRFSMWKKAIAKRLYVRNYLKFASSFVVLNKIEYCAISKMGYKQPVKIIPNGIDIPVLKKSFEPHKSMVDGKKIMLFIARLHPIKNLENLILAWLKIQSVACDWKLVIAGSTKDKVYENKLKELAKINSVQNSSIQFIGFLDEQQKPYWFENASAFVLTSWSEGIPMSVLEAFSYKVPAILTPECNLEQADKAGAALICKQDVDNISSSLQKMVTMKEEKRKLMGEKALELVQQYYTWENVCNLLIKEFQFHL